jgi:hypothetical protein
VVNKQLYGGLLLGKGIWKKEIEKGETGKEFL